jgi:iron complex outermembrane recepter protein
MSLMTWGKKYSDSSTRYASYKFAVEVDERTLLRCFTFGLLMNLSMVLMAKDDCSNSIPFNIPQQGVDLALITLAEQANRTLIFPFDETQAKTANRLVGTYSVEEAARILLKGTGLAATVSDDGQLTITTMQSHAGTKTMDNKNRMPSAFFAAIASLLGIQEAVAIENRDNHSIMLEEIVVTAEKREANLQDIPISITALSGDAMESIGIRTMEDFQFFAPGISITNDSMAIVNIRGIGTSAFGVATDPSSTVYVDGIYQPRPTTGYQDMFDIERVELLRGPQGVLFGRNSAGGSLNIISKAPSDEFEGSLGLTLGNYNKRALSGTVTGPFSDSARGRLTLLQSERDGIYSDIVSGKDYQNEDAFAARATLAFDLSENFELILRGDINNEDETGYINVRSIYPQEFRDAGAAIPTGDYDIALDTQPINQVDVWGVSSTATWTGEYLSLKSITSYRESEVKQVIDVDASNLSLFDIVFLENSQSITQELQLSNNDADQLEWIVGAFYLKEEGDGGIQLLKPAANVNITENNVTNAYALFGQGTYSITDRFRATLGLRYSYETKDYGFEVFVNGPQVDGATPDASWKAWTPRFALDFDLTEDVLAYLSATRGFKSGGFQLGDAGAFDPEFLWSYEAGLKSMLFDDRLRANVGIFQYDYTDLQVVEYVNSVATTSNAGEATIRGFEGEFITRLIDGVEVNATIAYLDAKYDVYFEDGVDFSGNRLSNSPEWTYSLGAQYVKDLGHYGDLTFRLDYAWRDNVDFKRNNLPQFRTDTYSLVNARAAFRSADDSWEISLYGKNLTDERYETYKTLGYNLQSNADASMPSTVYGDPRQYGIQVRSNF